MKKWLKRLGIGLGVVVLVLLVAVGGAYAYSVNKGARTYEIADATFEIPTDAASLVEGERLYIARGCGSGDCHEADGGGHILMDDPSAFGTIAAANLTTRTADYDAADWNRAVRHGVRPDGTSLVFMPALDYLHMSDHELGLIVAHVRALPRVETEQPACSPGMVGRMVDLAGGFVLFPAAAAEHDHVADPDPTPGRTVEYGGYLASVCTGCHGSHFSGGPIPGAPPELGIPLNLTQHESGLRDWTEDDFRAALREGRIRGGGQIPPEQMPWPILARMTDDEIGAIWMYLATVPPTPFGNR